MIEEVMHPCLRCTCEHCGTTWTVLVKPHKCPNCRTRHWNRQFLPYGKSVGVRSSKHLAEKVLPAIRLALQGKNYREIGELLGYSRQRAQKIIEPPDGIRLLVRERANGRCEDCEKTMIHGHIHHITTEGRTEDDYNDADNLKFLCIQCHQAKHSEFRRGNNTKLTVDMVREIKKMISNKKSGIVIAEHFGISKYTVKDIKSGDTWSSVLP